MDSTTKVEQQEEIAFDFPPFLRKYKDGRVERLIGTATVPASTDPTTGVESKDVILVPETGVSARLYLPKLANPHQKLPLLVYFHGGGFVIESAFSLAYHTYLNAQVAESNVIAVSVDYRLAPEHPLPTAYNDSWAALQWVGSHSSGSGPESWLNNHVDFARVFLGGDSAGANIAHNMLIRAKDAPLSGVEIVGSVMIHSFFWGGDPVGSEEQELEKRAMIEKIWKFVCPSSTGCDDPLINPATDPNLSGLGCGRVLICVAEKDSLRERGWFYSETLGKSGWGGVVEVFETEGENHVFHLFNPTCDKALELFKKVGSFLNQN